MALLPGVGRSSQKARKSGNSSPRVLGGLQRQGAGDDAEILAAGERAEEGRALDDGELDRLAVAEGREEPEAGEADVADVRRDVEAAEIETRAVVGEAADEPVLDE